MIANKFYDYFVNIGASLAEKIPKSGPSFERYLPEANRESIFLTPTNDIEIQRLINGMKLSAPGHDELSAKVIKPVIDSLSSPLTYIVNLSFNEGLFPSELKIAQIIPWYKNDDPMQFNNYRPVSLLPFFSKLFERLMYNRLIDFINKHKLLYDYQFGFRKNHSTFLALVTLLEQITTALDNAEFAICVLIDFRKAFDTVDHSILLQKLYHYGIRGNAHGWFQSYLSNRSQYVNYDNTTSKLKPIKCGVPQGSIVGPLLFLIYINDLSSVSNFLSAILFADDTTLFHSSRNLTQLTNIINTELTNVVNWLNANRLSLNVDKTNFMLFRPKGKNQECPSIQINGSEIKEVSSAKFLGVFIDNKLSWAEHINHISRKVSKSIGIIIKARKSFDNDTLFNLYNALILPHISYCIQVWGTAASVHIERLHVLQKKIVRIICGVHPRTHTQPLFQLLHLLNINQIRDYFVAIFMYKMKNNMMPAHFGQMFISAWEIHNYPTKFAERNSLYVHVVPNKRGKRTIRHFGRKLWNIVLDAIDVNCSIGSFKLSLKSF